MPEQLATLLDLLSLQAKVLASDVRSAVYSRGMPMSDRMMELSRTYTQAKLLQEEISQRGWA